MAIRVTYRDLQNAIMASQKLGFGNTSLMLEGLAKQMHDLEIAALYHYDLAPKIDRIQKKIDCIRSSIDSEKEKESCQKEFAWKKTFIATSEIIGAVAINGLGVLGSFKLSDMLNLPNMKYVAGAVFAIIGLWQLTNIFNGAFSGFQELEIMIKKTLDNVEQFLNEAL